MQATKCDLCKNLEAGTGWRMCFCGVDYHICTKCMKVIDTLVNKIKKVRDLK